MSTTSGQTSTVCPHLSSAYMNDTHSPLTGPQRAPLSDTQYVVLPLLALALVVALRPSWPVRIGGVVLHVLWTLNATKYSAGGGYEDYLKGSFLGCASLMALYNLVLTDPMMEWRHKSRPDTHPIDLPLWERVYWVFCAACNNRGLGWSFEVSMTHFAHLQHSILNSTANRYRIYLRCQVISAGISSNVEAVSLYGTCSSLMSLRRTRG